MGDYLQSEGAYERADSCFTEALHYAENEQDKSFLYPWSLEKMGSLRLEQERTDEAISVLKKAARVAFSFGDLDTYQKASMELATAYQRQGLFEKALQRLKIAYSVKDSLFSIEKEQIIQETDAKYQLIQNERKLAELNWENERKAKELLENQKKGQLYVLGMFLLAGGLLFIIQLYQQKQRSNQRLEQVNLMISKSLTEKEFLLKEIHHRVKNNLQIISSMLSLQSDQVQDPKVLSIMREGQNRVESMVLIHEHLYKSKDLTLIDCKEYIERLTNSLLRSYQVESNKIRVIHNIDPIPMKMDRIINLGLILNELISNALKYAFPNSSEGTLQIALKNEEGSIKLRVKDNGIGLPTHFNPKKSQTLGFQLVDAFVKKLNAKMAIQKNDGTEVTIDIPKNT